jgi:hypothetical protein
MGRTLVALFVAFCSLAATPPPDEPMYPAPGMNTCTAATVGYNFAAYNLQQCTAIPGQLCYYETVAYNWALGQALYWCYGTEL